MSPIFRTKFSIRTTLGLQKKSKKNCTIRLSLSSVHHSRYLQFFFWLSAYAFCDPYTTQLLGLNFTGFSRPYLRYRIFLLFFPTFTKIFQFKAFPYTFLNLCTLIIKIYNQSVIWFRYECSNLFAFYTLFRSLPRPSKAIKPSDPLYNYLLINSHIYFYV
jgi:hypothetical protein